VAVLFAVTAAVLVIAGVVGASYVPHPVLRAVVMLGWVALCVVTFGPLTIEMSTP